MIIKIVKPLNYARMSSYASKMKQAWAVDAKSVHEDWDKYFKSGGSSESKVSTDISLD